MNQLTRIQSPDGGTDVYVARPSSPPGPPIVALHAWWGLNQAFRNFVDRLAGDGFTVVAPDLFDGAVLGTIEEAEAFAQELDEEANTERLLGRAAAALDHVLALPEASRSRAAVLGVSFGAVYARWLGKLRPEVAAVVTYYGGSWDPSVDQPRAPVPWLSHWAAEDPYEDASEPRAQLERGMLGPASAAHAYPGTHHWFAEPDRPEYDEAAAEAAYRRTMEFLLKQIG